MRADLRFAADERLAKVKLSQVLSLLALLVTKNSFNSTKLDERLAHV